MATININHNLFSIYLNAETQFCWRGFRLKGVSIQVQYAAHIRIMSFIPKDITALNILLSILSVNDSLLYLVMRWLSFYLTHNPKNDISLFSVWLNMSTERWIAFILPLKASYSSARLSSEREQHEPAHGGNTSFFGKNLFNRKRHCQKLCKSLMSQNTRGAKFIFRWRPSVRVKILEFKLE